MVLFEQRQAVAEGASGVASHIFRAEHRAPIRDKADEVDTFQQLSGPVVGVEGDDVGLLEHEAVQFIERLPETPGRRGERLIRVDLFRPAEDVAQQRQGGGFPHAGGGDVVAGASVARFIVEIPEDDSRIVGEMGEDPLDIAFQTGALRQIVRRAVAGGLSPAGVVRVRKTNIVLIFQLSAISR